ncbi:MAG: TetR/AcrR family transcriptional regulator [bacterium]|nr:TetR/AcrR family transcriptional regulator [bacterium]MCP5066009.1 TetR/AcrR family transcriptional regulator [bacterium]
MAKQKKLDGGRAPRRNLSSARTRKGERTLGAILDAAVEIVSGHGFAALSQEAVAKRAGISQSTLRHYFPTKDELVAACFHRSLAEMGESISTILDAPRADPAAQLEESIALHLGFIMQGADGYFFESLAYWARNPEQRALRDEWYQWLHRSYAAIVQQARPDCSPAACRGKSYQLLTLTLGAWITLSTSRPNLLRKQAAGLKETLLEAARAIVLDDANTTS